MADMGTPRGAMPWISPTRPIAREALSQLDRPLHAWRTPVDLDPVEVFSEYQSQTLTEPEMEVRARGVRPEWRLEYVDLPDFESSQEDRDRYEACQRSIAGYSIDPRCLDAYVMIAYSIAAPEEIRRQVDGRKLTPQERLDVEAALAWAEAGVCVLQQSLPWPFVDYLPYDILDNRPVHRVLFTYAALLYLLHPRKAQIWFRAMIYMSPSDRMGARLYFAAPHQEK